MTTELIDVPTDAPRFKGIHIAYLCKGSIVSECGGFAYLQSIRSGALNVIAEDPEDSLIAQSYKAYLPGYVNRFRELLTSTVDMLLSPPSNHPQLATPYRDAAKQVSPKALDVTNAFTRPTGVRSGLGAELEEMIEGLRYVPSGNESGISSLLIVDDMFSRGRTAAALLMHLQRAGLPISCEITVACPLWMPQK